jgi:hypothetical protein
MEAAIAQQLLPLQEQGYRVLGAPTDHAAVGRVFGKGEIRVGYQSREFQKPTGLKIAGAPRVDATIQFEVVVELQDVQLATHGRAADVMEAIATLLTGFVPEAGCGSGLYPIKDGFVGRDKEAALWVYSAVYGLDRIIDMRAAA